MKFTVTWSRSAKAELAQIWLDAQARDSVTRAASDIERILRSDPLDAGESREGQRRILIVPPLTVVFETSIDDRVVTVLQTRQSKSKSGGND